MYTFLPRIFLDTAAWDYIYTKFKHLLEKHIIILDENWKIVKNSSLFIV